MRKINILLLVLLCSAAAFAQEITQGSLYAAGKKGTPLGACPLNNTKVLADISGFMARVKVVQEFENTFSEPIEAVYTFPLSQNSAVDNMTMKIGERTIRARIMKREEARQIYETAKSDGKTASLLDQERPNIFTQAVANIMPGEKVLIEISYVETLKYEDGSYEFVFPMTVGPRYIPGSVKDAAKIKSTYARERTGHDISVEVNVNAGVPVEEIRSDSHKVDQVNFSPNNSKVTLRDEKIIPNKDFILRYDVTGKRIEDAILTHRDAKGGFFTLMLQPPDKIATEDRTPKEIVFVLDTSGSMSGFPIEKAKEAMKMSLDGLYPEDTFNLITFAGDTHVLFDQPVPATQANLEKAQAFLETREGSGGTEMMTAIKAALEPSDSQSHLRIVCFMTDAYVGNENEIIAEIQKHPKARVFSFGIGSSVNRFLLDKMAEAGNGEVEYVALTDDGSKAAKKFYERVRTPLLTDLSIDWNGMPVADIYPNKLSDLFSAKPVILHGRYSKAASGTIKLKGKIAGQEYVREIAVNLPETEAANDVLSTLWARTRIDDLTSEKTKAGGNINAEKLDQMIAQIGIEFRLLTEFTSFVAVEERVVNQNGIPAKVAVPLAVPDGVKADQDSSFRRMEIIASLQRPSAGTSGAGGGGSLQSVVNVTSSQVSSLPSSSRKISGSSARRTPVSGQGTGSGSGSGSGFGYGGGSAATVEVTSSDSSATTNRGYTKITTNVSRKAVENLPKGASYKSMLKLIPGISADPSGRFQIDGLSGSENTFIIDGSEVMNFRTGMPNANRSTSLTGRAVIVPEPAYPPMARALKALGEVEVDIRIDKTGNVVSAKAVSGNQPLHKAAETAALLSKFDPAFFEGRAMRVRGSIVYDFKTVDSVEVSLRKMKLEPLTEEDKKAFALGEKLHFWLFALAERLKKGIQETTPNEAKFVKEGKAEIRLVLVQNTPSVIEKLKALGFEITSEKGVNIAGRIAIEKLAALAEVKEVKIVLPKV